MTTNLVARMSARAANRSAARIVVENILAGVMVQLKSVPDDIEGLVMKMLASEFQSLTSTPEDKKP